MNTFWIGFQYVYLFHLVYVNILNIFTKFVKKDAYVSYWGGGGINKSKLVQVNNLELGQTEAFPAHIYLKSALKRFNH